MESRIYELESRVSELEEKSWWWNFAAIVAGCFSVLGLISLGKDLWQWIFL
jgi:hypothetical protein